MCSSDLRPPTGLVPAAGAAAQVGVIGVEDAHRGTLQQAALDGPVGLKAAVALQVVGGEGGPQPDAGGQLRRRLDLIAAELHHQPLLLNLSLRLLIL